MIDTGKAAHHTILINRAPVMTLWAAVVTERLGFDHNEALSLGRAVAGLNAQSKGRHIGIFKPHEKAPRAARKRQLDERMLVEVCGRAVPAVVTVDGVRAVSGGKMIQPESVTTYLEGKFGENLNAVRVSMTRLAKSYTAVELGRSAYAV